MIDSLQNLTASLPPLFQWFGVMLAGAIPFIESHLAAVIGIVVGVNPLVAIIAAIVGNILAMLIFVLGAATVRGKVSRQTPERSPRRKRLRQAFDKYGVAGVSLLGQSILPSQVISAALVSFGASRNTVILWQIISIILWGTAFGVLSAFGIDFLGQR